MTPLKNILSNTFKKLGIKKKYEAYSVIINWKNIVGEEIAGNSWPLKVERGTLVLKVINPIWSHHLLMLKADLIKKINAYLNQNSIFDIWFIAGYDAQTQGFSNLKEQENINQEEIKPLRLDALEIAEINKVTQEVKDKKVRNKLNCVIIKQKALEKAKKSKGWKQCANCEALAPPDEKYCTVCNLAKNQTVETNGNIKNKENKENKLNDSKDKYLKKILWDSPWLTYAEVNGYIPCLPQEYEVAKKKLIHTLLKKIFQPEQSGLEKNNVKTCRLVLTMLLSGIKPGKLTQAHIDNTINKIREYRRASRNHL